MGGATGLLGLHDPGSLRGGAAFLGAFLTPPEPVYRARHGRRGGRLLVLGPLRGHVRDGIAFLRAVKFNPIVDKLILIGNAFGGRVQRRRAVCLEYYHPHFGVRGPQEEMLLRAVAALDPDLRTRYACYAFLLGAGWFATLSDDGADEILHRIRAWSYAIEIETAWGRVGICHGQPPTDLPWAAFTRRIEQGDDEALWAALGGQAWRTLHQGAPVQPFVAGLRRLATGLRLGRDQARRVGNIWYLASHQGPDAPARLHLLMVSAQGVVTEDGTVTQERVLHWTVRHPEPALGHPEDPAALRELLNKRAPTPTEARVRRRFWRFLQRISRCHELTQVAFGQAETPRA